MIVSNALDAKLLAIRRVASMPGPCASSPLQGGDLIELSSKLVRMRTASSLSLSVSSATLLLTMPRPPGRWSALMIRGLLWADVACPPSLGRRCPSSFSPGPDPHL